MNKVIYVIGAGGHSKVVIDSLLNSGLNPSGILSSSSVTGQKLYGIPILGGDELSEIFSPDECLLANGIGALPGNQVNKKVFSYWVDRGFQFLTVIHPSTIIAMDVVLGRGCQIMAGAVLQPAVSIGVGTVINTAVRVDHDCLIGEHCFIAPGVVICGGVKISNDVFIGAGSTVLPGVKIGRGSVVAAGVVVDRDVLDGDFVSR
jgi:UDP-perosamine 4-acetyltransferase